MSKPRYNWWPFILNIIRDYPYRCQDLRDLHSQKITLDPNGIHAGSGTARPVEQTALRSLPPQEQREYDAVRRAVIRTRLVPGGEDQLTVVRLTLWQRRMTLPGAADQLHVSARTARRYRNRFVLLVGMYYGFLTEEEYIEAVKKDNPGKSRTPSA